MKPSHCGGKGKERKGSRQIGACPAIPVACILQNRRAVFKVFVAAVGLPPRGGGQSRGELSQVPRLQHGACPLLPGWGLSPLAPASPAVVSCQNKPHDADLKFSPYSTPDSSPTTTCISGCANTIFMWFAEKLQNCAYDTFTVSASKHLIRGVIAATAAKRPRSGLVSKRATGTKGHLILAGQRSSCSRKENFAVTNTKHVHFTSPNQ